jgi:hypothetical protein
MADGPDLPIFLSTFKDEWEKIERLQTKLSGKSYTHIEPPKKGYSDKEKQLWEHKRRELNPVYYQYDEEISRWQKMIAERENRVLGGLHRIFRDYECPYLNWEALALKLIETPAYQSAWPVPVSQLKRVKGRSDAEWRVLALELTLVCDLFTVEPLAANPTDRTADLKRTIAFRMTAQLTPSPDTGRPASPSIQQAAAAVRAELLKMAEEVSLPSAVNKIPSVSRIRGIYYETMATVVENWREDGVVIPISLQMQKYMQMSQTLSALKKIAVRCESALRAD